MPESSKKIPPERIKYLNTSPVREIDNPNAYVLYWMEASQRTTDNHALEYAIQQANGIGLPVVVCFGLDANYPDANARSFWFLLEGLREAEAHLRERRIKFVLRYGQPDTVALKLSRRAALLVTDRGYLRHQRQWREYVASEAACRVAQVETDVTVPVEVVSGKQEYAARTIRSKLHKHADAFLIELNHTQPEHSSLETDTLKHEAELGDLPAIIRKLGVDTSVPPVSALYRGGQMEAKRVFRRFLDNHLAHYESNRNKPETNDVSCMSPYLHFGQVSPVWLLMEARKHRRGGDVGNVDTFVEELLVRRELSFNFVTYCGDYDAFSCLPGWARETLAEHARDERPYVYPRAELEAGETHDDYWNSAMKEMRETGYMHNYLRMYWGKKILEWSRTPEEGYETALAINNKYFLDGRDPNSYANVAWCFGLHDRAWTENPIFGKVRIMKASGLKRKCDMQGYASKVDYLARRAAETEAIEQLEAIGA